jgi:dihydroorotate dehydrogenase electron transfer subunit
MNRPKITEIIDNKQETINVKTLTFNFNENTKPGQFYMIWIPENDEIPMSVSLIENNTKGITYRKIGPATEALFDFCKGDKIGIRGPYGNGFKVEGKHILFVGGGTGLAMLYPAIVEAKKKNISSSVIFGIKTKQELYFSSRLNNICDNLIFTSDDGSIGEKGFASDIAIDYLKKNEFDSIITCGPELMMKKLFDNTQGIYFQASLERFMKCAIGLCGQCCIGNGIRVCKEGTIFDGKNLKNFKDFGFFKRDAAGRKIKV